MINESVADDLIIRYLKEDGRVCGDVVVWKVYIDFAFKHIPTLDVIINNSSGGTSNHLVNVTQLKDFLSSINYQGSVEDILNVYGISMGGDGRLSYLIPSSLKGTQYIIPESLGAENKPIDPKAAAGNKKLSFHEMPILTLASIAKPFADGAKKYGLKNFYDFESYVSVYLSALKRHLMLFEAGQDNTSDSNVHHVDSMIAGLMVMREKMLVGKIVDDRKILDNDTISKLEEMLNND